MNTKNTENTKMNNDWFNQQLEPVDLNNLEYIPDPEEPIEDWRVTRIDKHVRDDDDYIVPLKKPAEEEDPLAKLELVKTHSKMVEAVDYESTYKTMDPLFEMLFKPLDDPLFQPNPYLEELDRRLMEANLSEEERPCFNDALIRIEDFGLRYYHYHTMEVIRMGNQ